MSLIRPLHDWIALKRHEYSHPTFIVVGQKTHKGTVVAVGPGKLLKRWIEVKDPINGKPFRVRVGNEYGVRAPMHVKPEDIVEYSQHGWREEIIDGETYVFTRQDAVIGFDESGNTEGLQGHNSAVIP